MSQIIMKRITMICALVILCFSLASGILVVLPMIGKLTLEPNTSWINYFVIRHTVWRIPIEFYIATVALILLTARRSTSWSMVWSTVLLAVTLGMIRSNPYNASLWIMIIASFSSLCISSAFFDGGFKVFLREISDNIKQIHQQPTSVWKIVAAVLAVVFVLNYIHNEIIIQTSEEARDARLVDWYKDARNKAHVTDGIELKIFTDYQCPACSQLVPKYIETALSTGNDVVQLEFHDYPLDTACNDSPMFSLHPAACSAAYAARLIDIEMPNESQGFRFWLYSNQSELNDNIIMNRLKEIGINTPQNMFDDEIKKVVRADIQEAKAYGIGAVPSVVLNSVLLPSGLNPLLSNIN